MAKSNKIANFDEILKFIHRSDINSGAFVFKDLTTNLSRKEKFLSFTGKIQGFLAILLMVSTLYVKSDEIVSVILSFFVFIVIFVLSIQMIKTHSNKNVVKNLLKWCESLYDIKKKFQSEVNQNIAHKKLLKVQKYTEIVLKWFEKSIYVDTIIIIIIAPVATVFLPRIIPKFNVPLPFYLPFKEQNNFVTFFVTIFVQSILVVVSAAIDIFIYGFFFCIVSHIIGYLEIIQEIIETVFKDQMMTKVKQFDDALPEVSNGVLKMEILMEINDSIETINNDKVEFTKWMQILCDMITDVNSQINSLKLLYAEFFLFSEIQSFGSLFICGFIFTIVKEQYFLVICVTLNVFLFFFCYVNELILQKFENIEKGLYDIPWYFLSVKDKRMLLIALNCSRIQDGFTAVGIHKLTLDRFYTVIKAGYRNFLVLKDLVT